MIRGWLERGAGTLDTSKLFIFDHLALVGTPIHAIGTRRVSTAKPILACVVSTLRLVDPAVSVAFVARSGLNIILHIHS